MYEKSEEIITVGRLFRRHFEAPRCRVPSVNLYFKAFVSYRHEIIKNVPYLGRHPGFFTDYIRVKIFPPSLNELE